MTRLVSNAARLQLLLVGTAVICNALAFLPVSRMSTTKMTKNVSSKLRPSSFDIQSRQQQELSSSFRQNVGPLYYRNDTAASTEFSTTSTTAPAAPGSNTSSSSCPMQRFQRQASNITDLDNECILTIGGQRYNVTSYGHAHPGGAKIMTKFHGKDATKVFEAAAHSADAYGLLEQFRITDDDQEDTYLPVSSGESEDKTATATATATETMPRPLGLGHKSSFRARFRKKLFTNEDPVGVHKYLGLFCLLNFIGRFYQMYFGDPTAGLGRQGHPYFSLLCLIPHGLLSVSSLIFHTVPRSRVVGKPMIWKEYRWHNIIFGLRSVLTAIAATLAIKFGNTTAVRSAAVGFSSACVFISCYAADVATDRLRAVEVESTTATMPYWEGCSIETQKRFKSFYAYCQFMATLACLAVGNPAWPLSVLLAIQMASLLMTLVRKGLLSAQGYHLGYTACLILPYFVGLRSMVYSGTLEFPIMCFLAGILYNLRRRGVPKYALWTPVVATRFLLGDAIFPSFQVW